MPALSRHLGNANEAKQGFLPSSTIQYLLANVVKCKWKISCPDPK